MHQVILYFHIGCGSLALLSGIIALITKKGHSLHIQSGKIFYWAMIAVASSSFLLAIIKFNAFLLAIGVFTLYMILRGRRYIYYHRLTENYAYKMIDNLPVYIALITSIFMIGFPIYQIAKNGESTVFVLGVFGLILLLNVRNDFKMILAHPMVKPGNQDWILKHIGMMTGAYIASTTAFLVNAIHVEPSWILWLAPSAIGVPYIFISIRKWKRNHQNG